MLQIFFGFFLQRKLRKRRELIWKCNFTVKNDELCKKRRSQLKKRRTLLSMPSRSCDPSFITDPFRSVVFYGEVTLWDANPSFFKFSLLRSVVFSVNSSCYKSVRRFFKTHPSFFQNHVHEKILILTTFYGTKTIAEVKWKVDNASQSADTKGSDAIHHHLDVQSLTL